jgi:large subunit ribosomal protein L4e
MTKLKIMTTENSENGAIEMPSQFKESLREDIIARAVLAIQAASRQPYGGYGDAGMRHSTKLSRRRRDYKTSYGYGISRVPRKIMNRRGRRMGWVGALAPGTVGGRAAHGPKPYKDWEQKISTSENRKAIRSALSATVDAQIVSKRGHKIPKAFPFIIDDALENVSKTADLQAALVKLGFAEELVRAGISRIRAGRGKSRGRKHKSPTSILFVVSKDATPLVKAAANMPGCDIIAVHRVNASLLAPGTHAGRLTLYTKGAVERLAKENLFLQSYKGTSGEKAAAPVKEKKEKKAEPKTAAPKATAPKKEKSEAKPATTAVKPAAKAAAKK